MPAEAPMEVRLDNERGVWVFDHHETKNGTTLRHIVAYVDQASAQADYDAGACYSCP